MLHYSVVINVGVVIMLVSMVKLHLDNVVCLVVGTYLHCVEVLGEIEFMT